MFAMIVILTRQRLKKEVNGMEDGSVVARSKAAQASGSGEGDLSSSKIFDHLFAINSYVMTSYVSFPLREKKSWTML